MGLLTQQLQTLCQSKDIRYVGTRGNVHAPVVVVGEAAGADEDACGLPFVGASGQEQDRMLTDAGLTLSDVWFTNPYKVRPPNNDLDRLEELGIPKTEFEAAFFEELSEYKPTIILAVGATAAGLLLPQTMTKRSESAPISHIRGSLMRSPRLAWEHYVVPVQHPAFVLREWSERQISVFCYARALEELVYWRQHGTLNPLPVRALLAEQSFDATMAWLETTEAAHTLALDIEMTPSRNAQLRWKTVYLIGLATSPRNALSFSPWDYPVARTRELLRKTNKLLRAKRVVTHNGLNFDMPWVETIGLKTCLETAEDTRVMHHVLYPEFSHKLEFLTMQFTREPYYKQEGKGVNVNSKADRLRYGRYNGLDAAVDYECYEVMKGELSAAV